MDEFQNFATMSFVQLLSEARKYKLFLTMVEQSTAQQEQPRTFNTILANVGTMVCFRTGSPVDEQYLLPFFEPSVGQGEISSLPTYNFYARIPAMVPQEPVSGETLLVDSLPRPDIAQRVIAASRRNYASRYNSDTEGLHRASNQPSAATKQPQPANQLAADFPGEPIT
jgi:hypothetical protein